MVSETSDFSVHNKFVSSFIKTVDSKERNKKRANVIIPKNIAKNPLNVLAPEFYI